jgi:elongation factor G
MGVEDTFQGSIDVIERKAYVFEQYTKKEIPVPEEYKEQLEEARQFLIEKIADYNEEIMELFLDGKDVETDMLKKAARDATLKVMITPVFCGSSYKNKGVHLLLDAIVAYLPSPIDVGSTVGLDMDNPEKTHTRHPNVKDPFCGLAFKLINDTYVGQQTFVRIYSGEMRTGMQVYNSTKDKEERIGRILKIKANDREDIEVAGPGDIVALIGMKYTKTGDTLCDPAHPLYLENIFIPPAVIELKITPPTKKEDEKLGAGLRRLTMEDPSFNVRYDDETNETIISGMGELHLEIMVDRLKHEFGIEAVIGEPSVAFREAITLEHEVNYKHAKQTGGKGQYAHVVLRVEPNEGKGFEFVDHIKGGAIPAEFIPSVQKGIEPVLAKGILAGFPIVDVKVVLLDGSYHDVDSSDMAFRICAAIAFKQAFLKCNPILLEPMMKLEVNTPDDYIGDVIGDINRRRGKIESMRRYRKGAQKLNGFVPLMEMFGYATQLRNISSGRANYSMEFHKYVPSPKDVQEKVLKKIEDKKTEK